MSDTAPTSGEAITAIVLVCGRGTRITAIHPMTAKPMIPVLGRPFLHWLPAYLARQGLRRFVYASGYRGEQIEDWTRDDSFPHVSRIVRQEETPLGTGGAVQHSLDLCGYWTLVVNGGELCLGGIEDLLAPHRSAGPRRRPHRCRGGGHLVLRQLRHRGRRHDERLSRESPQPGLRQERNLPLPYGFAGGTRAESLQRHMIPDLLAADARLAVVRAVDAPSINISLPETLCQVERFARTHLGVI